jgi:hypothetical protein
MNMRDYPWHQKRKKVQSEWETIETFLLWIRKELGAQGPYVDPDLIYRYFGIDKVAYMKEEQRMVRDFMCLLETESEDL